MEHKLKKYTETAGRDGYSINEFCVRFGMSTASYYKMRAAGEGPREMRMVGSLVRITEDAIADWKRERENADAAEPHRQKLKERSLNAGAGGRA